MRREKKKCGPINLYNKHTYKQKKTIHHLQRLPLEGFYQI